jgi:hypothetical protein
MTTGERTAQIDHELDASLGVFDGRMRQEQAVLAGQRNGRGGSSGDAEGQEGNGEGAAGSGPGQSGEKGAGSTAGGQNGKGSGGQSNGTQGNGQGQGNVGNGGDKGGGGGVGGGGARGGSGPNTVPADIPDGSDDDIVARQLREAAMKETDPELREKLWQEYRNYKKSTG